MVNVWSMSCLYASQWPGPTALPHLLAVELGAVLIFVWSWNSLWRDYVAKTMMGNGYVVSRQCVKDWVDQVFWFQVSSDQVFPECGGECALTDEEKSAIMSVFMSANGLGMQARPFVIWFPTVVAMALVIYVLIAWIMTPGAKNVGSGAYLSFTWNITQRRPYRFLMYIMLLLPALGGGGLMVAWVFNVSDANRLAIQDNIPNLLVLVLTVKALLFPNIPIHHWKSEDFDKIVFQRTFSCYTQPNCRFGVKLVNALWLAQNGHTAALRALVSNEADYGNLLEVARAAESQLFGQAPVKTTRPFECHASEFQPDCERPESAPASPPPRDSAASQSESPQSVSSAIALEARAMRAVACSADGNAMGVGLDAAVGSLHKCVMHAVSVGDSDVEKVATKACGADVVQGRDELMAACIELRSRMRHLQVQRDNLKHQLLVSSEKLTRALHGNLAEAHPEGDGTSSGLEHTARTELEQLRARWEILKHSAVTM